MVNANDEMLLEKWFLVRNIREGTQITYLQAVNEYKKLLKKSLTDLLDDARSQNLSQIEILDRNVTLNLLKFKKHLSDCGKAPSTINLYFAAVKSFYRAYQIQLPDIKMDKGDIGLEKNIGKPLRRKEICKLISAANHRERALIYLMALSGMGQQEARDLRIKTLIESANQAVDVEVKTLADLFSHEDRILEEVLTLEITRKKVSYRHHTFLPPEATREILSYLKERCYGKNEKIRVQSIDDKIFVNKQGGELGRDSVVTNFRNIGIDAGFEKEKGSYCFWRSHALRKYFITTIINKLGSKTLADYMAGHKINNQDRTYWKPDPEDLKEFYIKALPYLSIDGAKVKDLDRNTIQEYEARIAALEKNRIDHKALLNDPEFLKDILELIKS